MIEISSPLLGLVAPAATFVVILNTRQARISQIIRDNSGVIFELINTFRLHEKDQLYPVKDMTAEIWKSRYVKALNSLHDENYILMKRHKQIMKSIRSLFIGLSLFGFITVLIPSITSLSKPWVFSRIDWQSLLEIWLPALIMSIGLHHTYVEMKYSESALAILLSRYNSTAVDAGLMANSDATRTETVKNSVVDLINQSLLTVEERNQLIAGLVDAYKPHSLNDPIK